MDMPTRVYYQKILGRDEISAELARLHDSLEGFAMLGSTLMPNHVMCNVCALIAGERVESTKDGPRFYREVPSSMKTTEITATPIEVEPAAPEPPAAKPETAKAPETPALPVEPAVAPPLNGKPIIGLGGFDWRQFIGKEVEHDSGGWKRCKLLGFDANQNASIKWRNRKQPKHGVELEKLRPVPPEDVDE